MLIHTALLNKTNQASCSCNDNLPKAKTSLFRKSKMGKYSMTSISIYLKQIQNAYLQWELPFVYIALHINFNELILIHIPFVTFYTFHYLKKINMLFSDCITLWYGGKFVWLYIFLKWYLKEKNHDALQAN